MTPQPIPPLRQPSNNENVPSSVGNPGLVSTQNSQQPSGPLYASKMLPQANREGVRIRAPYKITPFMIIMGLILIFLVVGGIIIWFVSRKFFSTPDTNVNVNQVSFVVENMNQNTAAANLNTSVNEAVYVPQPDTDNDNDGVPNDEEEKLGTNPAVADSDSDGLSDYEEVHVYKTDPLKKDTDGDSFSDGDEVDGFYDPNGPGMLRDINADIKSAVPIKN